MKKVDVNTWKERVKTKDGVLDTIKNWLTTDRIQQPIAGYASKFEKDENGNLHFSVADHEFVILGHAPVEVIEFNMATVVASFTLYEIVPQTPFSHKKKRIPAFNFTLSDDGNMSFGRGNSSDSRFEYNHDKRAFLHTLTERIWDMIGLPKLYSATITKFNFMPLDKKIDSNLYLTVRIEGSESDFALEPENDSIEGLSKKFEFEIEAGDSWNFTGLKGRTCEVAEKGGSLYFSKFI